MERPTIGILQRELELSAHMERKSNGAEIDDPADGESRPAQETPADAEAPQETPGAPSVSEEEAPHRIWESELVAGPGPVPEAWQRYVRNAEMPEEMVDLFAEYHERNLPLTPELMKFF
eukprot:11455906-Karenia_brevis.AAC.1